MLTHHTVCLTLTLAFVYPSAPLRRCIAIKSIRHIYGDIPCSSGLAVATRALRTMPDTVRIFESLVELKKLSHDYLHREIRQLYRTQNEFPFCISRVRDHLR